MTARLADAYKIDLGSNSQATLNFTGFEGTTKKNRPNLSIGDVVYARVSIANKDMEPELVCLDAENRSEGFGEIKDGMMFTCPCYLTKRFQQLFWHLYGLGFKCLIIGFWNCLESISPLK